MTQPSVLVMTGNKLRHRFYALQILARYPDGLVLFERQPPSPWGSHVRGTQPTHLVRRHFEEFAKTETTMFGAIVEDQHEVLRSRTFLEIDEGSINDPAIIERVADLNPQLIAVLSTSLIRDAFIRRFPLRLVNFHAGLSPYYRGSGTNVFPFYNNELQYVGVTLHYIDAGIDTGPIILHGRPVFDPDDNTHTIGCKNVQVAAQLLCRIADSYLEKGPPAGVEQNLTIGRAYRNREFTDEVVRVVNANIERGIVRDYARVQPKPVDLVECLHYG